MTGQEDRLAVDAARVGKVVILIDESYVVERIGVFGLHECKGQEDDAQVKRIGHFHAGKNFAIDIIDRQLLQVVFGFGWKHSHLTL